MFLRTLSDNVFYHGEGKIKILSPAKINLFLHVTGKREDGYHDLVTLMCPIGLCDTLCLDFNSTDILVSCAHKDVPEDERNLAHLAATLFFKKIPSSLRNTIKGVKIHIDKNIPVAAGLGGGSSNAASVITALNLYFGKPFSKEKLADLGLTLGADIPFFIFQGPAIAKGIGERLESFSGLKPLPLLIVNPDVGVSTKEVYKNLNLGLTKCKEKLKNNVFKKAYIKKFGSTKFGSTKLARILCNDLEIVTAAIHPEIIAIKKSLLNNGATGALMTGSGPTVFGLFPDFQSAMKAYSSFIEKGKWKVFFTNLLV